MKLTVFRIDFSSDSVIWSESANPVVFRYQLKVFSKVLGSSCFLGFCLLSSSPLRFYDNLGVVVVWI
jgi:hypothetical protein